MIVEFTNVFLFLCGVLFQTAMRLGSDMFSRKYLQTVLTVVGITMLFSFIIFIQGGPLRVLIPVMFLFYLICVTTFNFFDRLTPITNEEIILWHTILFWWLVSASNMGYVKPLLIFCGIIPTIAVVYSCFTKSYNAILTLILYGWHLFTALVFGMIGYSFFHLMDMVQPVQFVTLQPGNMFIAGMMSMFVIPYIFSIQLAFLGFSILLDKNNRTKPLNLLAGKFSPIQITPVRIVRSIGILAVILVLGTVYSLNPILIVNIVMVSLPKIVVLDPANGFNCVRKFFKKNKK